LNAELSFLRTIQPELEQVELLMRTQVKDREPNLRDAVYHLLGSGGKRLRPALSLLAGKAIGADVDKLVILASAIELVHTASLVHDDLIDGALLRRGTPTLNSKWSSSATVLTGDFLFACSARLAADTNSIPVMKQFADTVSILADGEVKQMFAGPCSIDREDYYKRIHAKTASLFETCSLAAAMLGTEDPEILNNMRQFGYDIGMAFQIIDDVFDFTSDASVLGKPVGNDIRQGLITLPTLCYIETYPQDSLVQTLVTGKCIQDEEMLQQFIHSITNSDAITQSRDEAGRFVNHGIQCLNSVVGIKEKQPLIELADYIVSRET
jgi:geranylgeranyl pyrophosphate synthase